jgi:hypothetical protein
MRHDDQPAQDEVELDEGATRDEDISAETREVLAKEVDLDASPAVLLD